MAHHDGDRQQGWQGGGMGYREGGPEGHGNSGGYGDYGRGNWGPGGPGQGAGSQQSGGGRGGGGSDAGNSGGQGSRGIRRAAVTKVVPKAGPAVKATARAVGRWVASAGEARSASTTRRSG
jgi:hypothetical protein